MPFTYASFVADLATLPVAGVKRFYTHSPAQLSTPDLPALYLRLPAGENLVVTIGSLQGLRRAACEVVIAVDPVMQNQQEPNFATCVALLDALEDAIVASASNMGLDTWAMRVEREFVGNTAYWLLIATVQGSG